MKTIALLTTLLLAGCSAHTLEQSPPPPPFVMPKDEVVPVAQPTMITGQRYSFTEPANIKLINMKSDEQKGDMLIDDPNNLFVLVKVGEVFEEPFEVFATTIGMTLANSGFAFSIVEPIVWLNNQGLSFSITRGWLTAYTWLGLVSGTGVALTCGGLSKDEAKNAEVCKQIAGTFSLITAH